MGRRKNNDSPAVINGNVALPEELRELPKEFRILEAVNKDGFCHHVYMYLTGVEKGNKQKSNSIYLVKDELKNAFARFNVHMACIDDLFKYGGVEVEDIDKYHDHEFTYLMECTGFKIYGDEDNEKIALIGTKHLSGNLISQLELPKIPLDNLSSYKWYNELKAVADEARRQVQLYHFGNYTIPEDQVDEEEETKKGKYKQTKLQVLTPTTEEGDAGQVEEAITDAEFEDEFGEARL